MSTEEAVFKGKVAIVTGAGRGIGAATAKLLAAKGAKVALLSRTATELDEITREIGAERAMALVTDVSDEAAVKKAFEAVKKKWGPVQILVNNAGAIVVAPVISMNVADWDRVQAVNVRGTFLCSREAFKQMKDSKQGGAIVNISSLGGIRSTAKFEGFSAYVASKHAVAGLTESLAVEGKPLGIRANCVAPGAVDTKMFRDAVPFLKTSTQPEDIAELIVYLCDEKRAKSLNGAVIEVNSNE